MSKRIYDDDIQHTIETEVSGIPCIAAVTHYDPGYAGRGLSGPVDSYMDISPPEPECVEFEILDRKGYPAGWLIRKANDEDFERIERELLEAARWDNID